MINFFSVMIYISTIVALASSILLLVGLVIKSKFITSLEVFIACNNQIKVCRITSVVFAALYWFVVSGFATLDCLKGYAKLSATCSILGCIWILFAFINIGIGVFLGITKKGQDELEIVGNMRKSSFLMGAIFLTLSFILKVN